YAPVVKQAWWTVSIEAFKIGNQLLSITGRTGAIDTGTSLIVVPKSDFDLINFQLGGTLDTTRGLYKFDCDFVSELPTVSLKFGGRYFDLTPQEYVWFQGQSCISPFTSGGVGENSMWIVGDTFLRSYYTVYDFALDRVGFANSTRFAAPPEEKPDLTSQGNDNGNVGNNVAVATKTELNVEANSLSAGGIFGIVISIVLILGLLIFLFLRKKKEVNFKKKVSSSSTIKNNINKMKDFRTTSSKKKKFSNLEKLEEGKIISSTRRINSPVSPTKLTRRRSSIKKADIGEFLQPIGKIVDDDKILDLIDKDIFKNGFNESVVSEEQRSSIIKVPDLSVQRKKMEQDLKNQLDLPTTEFRNFI
ncbi:Vacuolar protease A, partial [Lobulomyces angularis]